MTMMRRNGFIERIAILLGIFPAPPPKKDGDLI